MYAAMLACILNVATVTWNEKPASGDLWIDYNGPIGLALDEATDHYIDAYTETLNRYEELGKPAWWIKDRRMELGFWQSHSKIVGNWWDKEWFRYGEPRIHAYYGSPGDIIDWGPFRFSSKMKFSLKDYSWEFKDSSPYSYTIKAKPSISLSTSTAFFVSNTRFELQAHLYYKEFRYLVLSSWIGWSPSTGPMVYTGAECKVW